MFGLDDQIAALSGGQVFLVVMAIAALLGLRHATDPDHLTAVSTLVAGERDFGPRRAGALGLSWGLGHATTLFLFGLPIVLFNSYLPDALQTGAEIAVGVVIMALALRLLLRWRRGHFHVHEHRHNGGAEHRHLHDHAARPDSHEHGHVSERLGRSPLQAYGIGLIHGMGGSAGVGILLLAAIPDHVEGVVALALFAACTAVSMSLASSTLGYALSRGAVMHRFVAVAPALGTLSLAFGAWYALGAAGALPYYF
jgi:ABC-type nickel/cobalt efflux system permease component RcnA